MEEFYSRNARRADDEIAGDEGALPRKGARAGGSEPGGIPTGGVFADLPIEEEPMPYASLPMAVRKSVEEHLPGASRHDAVRMQMGEVVLYHVVAVRSRTGLAVTVSPSGDLVELERDVAPSRVPKAVKEALAAYYPHVQFSGAGMVTMHFYEFEYEDDNNVHRVVQVDASGRILQDVDEESA